MRSNWSISERKRAYVYQQTVAARGRRKRAVLNLRWQGRLLPRAHICRPLELRRADFELLTHSYLTRGK